MRMKTPAITNQYGEIYTGMPNGRARTIPGPASRRCGFFFCGVVMATIPMLRAVLYHSGGATPRNPRSPLWCPPSASRDRRAVLAPASPPQTLADRDKCRCGALRFKGGRDGAGPGGGPPGNADGAGAFAVTRGRFHDVPFAVPVPGDRPAARAADSGHGARDAGARRAGA